MTNFSNASVRRLARHLLGVSYRERLDVLEHLDTEFKLAVVEELTILKNDIPLELADTTPPGSFIPE